MSKSVEGMPAENPTGVQILRAVSEGQRDVLLDSNPAFVSFSARLIEGKPGEVTVGFTAGPETTQGNGVVSGGAMATMLDLAMAVATISALPATQTCTTISLTVNMISAARLGKLMAVATVERAGRRIVYASAKLFDENRKLIATGMSSLAILSPKSE